MKLALGNVTLCAVDCVARPLAARALEISSGHCDFADSILVSDEPVEGSFRNLKIERLTSIAAYSSFMLKGLNAIISTPYVLVTQWDGYVIHPAAWNAEFLNYDYIGSVWPQFPDRRVGNGGFSLRSKRLLEALDDPRFTLQPNMAEDELICRLYRPLLEQQFGMRFPTEATAERFAYECTVPGAPTFGFHGIFNFWREMSDTDLTQIAPMIPPATFQHVHCAQLALAYLECRRWTPLRTLYTAWRSHHSLDAVRQLIFSTVHPQVAPALLQICEQLIQL